MIVEVRALYRGGRRYEQPVRRLVRTLLTLLGRANGRLDVLLVDAAFVRRFRRDARRHNRSDLLRPLHRDGFNVLSFSPGEAFPISRGRRAGMGEIYLHLPYIRRHGESLLALLTHGLLHLEGYDHRLRHDRMEMEELEQSLERALRERHRPRRDLQFG